MPHLPSCPLWYSHPSVRSTRRVAFTSASVRFPPAPAAAGGVGRSVCSGRALGCWPACSLVAVRESSWFTSARVCFPPALSAAGRVGRLSCCGRALGCWPARSAAGDVGLVGGSAQCRVNPILSRASRAVWAARSLPFFFLAPLRVFAILLLVINTRSRMVAVWGKILPLRVDNAKNMPLSRSTNDICRTSVEADPPTPVQYFCHRLRFCHAFAPTKPLSTTLLPRFLLSLRASSPSATAGAIKAWLAHRLGCQPQRCAPSGLRRALCSPA